MKKFLLLLLIICGLLTSCTSDVSEDDDDMIKIGSIRYMNVAENELLKARCLDKNYKPNSKQVLFDNMNAMIFALQSGQIDEISTYESMAIYMENIYPEFEWKFAQPVMTDNFCFALREDDTALKKEFDDAIAELTADGTLFKLDYLAEIHSNKTPQIIHMPHFNGAPTINVAVTGDLPMLDYVRPDGSPAGFNTAFLAEISKRIKKNFVLIQIESGARSIALTSRKVDVIFWAVKPNDDGVALPDFDAPKGIILTDPYFSDEIVHVRLKK